MISSNFKDDENEKAGEVLTGLLDEDFTPDLWRRSDREKVDNAMKEILDIGISELISLPPDVLLLKLKEKNFSPAQFEQFGDLALNISDMEPEIQSKLGGHAVAVYEHSLNASKTYSFGLIAKITEAKDLL